TLGDTVVVERSSQAVHDNLGKAIKLFIAAQNNKTRDYCATAVYDKCWTILISRVSAEMENFEAEMRSSRSGEFGAYRTLLGRASNEGVSERRRSSAKSSKRTKEMKGIAESLGLNPGRTDFKKRIG